MNKHSRQVYIPKAAQSGRKVHLSGIPVLLILDIHAHVLISRLTEKYATQHFFLQKSSLWTR